MNDYSHYRYLKVGVRDGVAYIVITKPERFNACDLADHREFSRILRDIAADDSVRVAVVTGMGKAFSIGGDLDLLERVLDQSSDDAETLFADARELVHAHVELDKPVIAAVNGHAMGSGAAFALFCDFIIMETQATIADGHIRAALSAGDGGALIWPLAVGLTRAKKYLLTGDGIGAVEAERIGLVTEVVEEGASLGRATEIAQRLAAGPQRAIRYTKRALNQTLAAALPTFDLSLALEMRSMGTAEAAAAIAELQTTRRPAIAPET